ncbi:holo-ACP synthase [Sporosarcina sp. BI001-red]|uniref:holo-ACP synthase n=1 Tax=Sporosarcina sp. BI001-red TaxID=2282866 RepID=UPI000E2315D0|nr:holo-ACP synthase [Sporosarcina sp. BI001-red]REB07766.1 holo-ACP synthase [Sporosarcina sp. BI001-red]
MISGIGLDITELDRIAELDNKSDKFRNRILTTEEQQYYQKLSGHRRVEFLAGRFAAKEAYAKALGTGIGPTCSFLDIAILPNEKGAPFLYFKGKAVDGFVSITHTKKVAAAQVILQKM